MSTSAQSQMRTRMFARTAGNAVYSSGATAAIWVVFICLASAGLYLTYVGWKPQPRTPHATANPTQDRPMPRVIKHRDIRRAEMLDRALELH